MRESKIELTRRLMSEGRWDEASRYRDESRRRLRSEGQTKRQAAEGAWAEMAAEFPPLPPAVVDVSAEVPPDDDEEAFVAVRAAILEVAEGEVSAWCERNGIGLSEEAFAELAGTLGAFWALGTLGELPTSGQNAAEAGAGG